MHRRDFVKALGSGPLVAVAHPFIAAATAADTTRRPDIAPSGGSVSAPPKAYLFTDQRLIQPGDVEWASPDGKALPLNDPPPPVVEAHAVPKQMPYGIRFVAQPARIDVMDGDPPVVSGQVLEVDGSYLAIEMRAEYPPGKDLGANSTALPTAVSIMVSESRDLQTWTERGRNRFDIPGQTQMDGFTAFHDPHGSPEERFKAVYMSRPPEGEIPALWAEYQKLPPRDRDRRIDGRGVMSCIYGATSPDGITWTPIAKPLFVHKSDTDTTVLYDESLGGYVMYTRLYPLERRVVAICEAKDFRRWGPVRPLLWPGLEEPQSTDIYHNVRTHPPGMPEVKLMFPLFYDRFDQTSATRLFTSVDGLQWSQVPGGPVLSRKSFTDSSIEHPVVKKPLLPLPHDRVGLRYNAARYPHKYPRWSEGLRPGQSGWAWWEKGRLVAVTADEEGEFTTFFIPVMGRELRLNARTPRGGMIKVGLRGRKLDDCDPVVGDDLAHPIRWKGKADVGLALGESVALTFRLRRAELFGFEWV
jgi:hypothetical protein